MADGGGDGGEYIYIPSLSDTTTEMADARPPPFKIRKLDAPGTSSIEAEDEMTLMDFIPEFADEKHKYPGEAEMVQTTPISISHQQTSKQQIEIMTTPGEVEMDGSKSKSVIAEQQIWIRTSKSKPVNAEQEIDNRTTPGEVEMDGIKSKSVIAEQEIEDLCVQMDEMASLMRYRIKPSAPLSSSSSSNETEDRPVIDDILKELADLQGSMSKLKSQLKPFWHKYPHDEDYVVPEEEEMDPKEQARKDMEDDQEIFDSYRQGVERKVGHFGCTTVVSPMHFTHYTPRQIPYNYTTRGITLQIFSFKIAKISLDLEWPLLQWPLKVYGVVAARDNVDRKRNILFHRQRDNFQEITQEDSFLCLTGPSRAISAECPLEFEVQLKLKGDAAKSEDSVLINKKGHYGGYHTHNGLYTVTFDNCLCTAELSLQKLYRGAVQATFLRVGIVKGSQSPFSYGGRVACSSPPHKDDEDPATPTQVVLLDSRDCAGGKMPIGEEDGYLDLSRHVVSVELRTVSDDSEELEETLNVFIEAYSDSPPKVSAKADFMVKPQYCGISEHECVLHGSTVKITIAWSPILRTNKIILSEG